MKTTIVRRALAVLLCLTMLLGAVAMTACSRKGATLLELKGHTISVNQYQLLLSRVKASLYYAGYSVDSATFWDMVIDSEGNTYDQYFRNAALSDAKRYLAAAVIFDEEGLVLPQSYKDAIDEDIEEYIRDAGSKSALNSTLSAYGVNIDMLRDLYELEAKYAYVQAYLYGAEGEKIAANVRYDYLTEHAVCFKQVLIRAFDYVYETDLNGDEIYYKVGDNNAKVNNIAYDTVQGNPRMDEFDKTIVDKNGDTVYYLPNGSIAYDTVNGVRAVVYDANGVAKTVKYSAEELAEHKAAGEEIMASVVKGDYAAFEALLAEYEVSGDDAFVTDGISVRTKTNHCGGILGGMTSGMPLIFRVAMKPTPSISRPQESVDLCSMTPVTLSVKGRHDPCVAVRAVPVLEAAAAIAITDLLLDKKEI